MLHTTLIKEIKIVNEKLKQITGKTGKFSKEKVTSVL